MKTLTAVAVTAAIASAMVSGVVVAQAAEEITVQGTRVLDEKSAGRTSTGIPIRDISLSYGINIADLNLASQYGPIELEKRVHKAAKTACEEIGRRYPLSTPSDAVCTKVATDKAMVKVHELVAEARQKLPQ